jgi:DNA-binding protein Fis
VEDRHFHQLKIHVFDTDIQREIVMPLKRTAFLAVLRAYEWNQSKAAAALGMNEEGLRSVIKDTNFQFNPCRLGESGNPTKT